MRGAGEGVDLLLVEDDTQFAELLRTQLRRVGWTQSRLEVATTLAEARAKLAPSSSFSLVITDLNLPDSFGADTVAAVAAATDVPVIVLTGDVNPTMRAAALEHGAYDFLSKQELSAAALERLLRLASIQAGTLRLLRHSEARFRELIVLSSDFYWESDGQHRVVKIEHGAQRHSVANPGQIGSARWELPSTYPDAEGWAEHRAAMDAHLPFRDFEIARLDDDGVERWRAISGEPIFDASGVFRGYRGVGRDITERKRTEDELRRFRLAMDNSADMIVLIDRGSMRFIDVNRRMCTLLGYSREEMLAMGPQDILPVTRAELERSYDRLIGDPSLAGSMNSHYRCKDGSSVPFESTRHVLRSGERWLIAAISRDVRERLAAEQALRESEARFRRLTELSSDWYWEQDEEHRFTVLPESGPRGLDSGWRSRLLGTRRWDQHYFNMGEADWAAHRALLDARQPFRDLELGRVTARGEKVWVAISGEPVLDAAGRFRGYRGIGRDITARKRDEQLRELEHTVTRSLAEAADASTALRGVMRAVCETEGWECGRYFAPEGERGTLHLRESWSVDDEAVRRFLAGSRDLTYAAGAGIVGQAWTSGQPIWVADVLSDSRSSQTALAREGGIHGTFAFAVKAEGRPIGVLTFNSRDVRQPEEGLLQAVSVIGSQVGQFLRRKAAETARQRDQEALRRFRAAMDTTADMIMLIDRETMRYVDVNATACELQGYTREEMLQMGPADVTPIPRAELERTYDAMIASGETTTLVHSQQFRKSGPPIPVEVMRRAVRSGGRWLIVAIVRDISERLAADEALRESEARFRSLTQLSSDWFWQTDAEHGFVDTPDRVTQLTGMTSKSYVGKRRWEVEGLSPVGGDWTAHRQVLERRESFRDFELVQMKAGGSRAYLQVSGEPVFDSAGRFQGYRGTARDITVRKREEEELRRFRAAMDMSFDAIYLVERSTMRFVDVNEAGCRGVGYEREELLRMGPHQVLKVPLETLEREYDALIAEGERGTRLETSYVSKGGRRRWAELHRRALRTAEGLIIVTISRDITERKSAEERKAVHLRYQERIARFGQAALAKREPAELIDSAVQEVLEGLGADAVAYVERGPSERELVVRALVGVADHSAIGPLSCRPDDALLHVLRGGNRRLVDGAALPLAWATGLRGAALVPVRGERAPRGVLCVFYASADAFRPEELNFVEAGASVLSTGLQRIDSEGRLTYLAQFDALTGLPNRALLADRFSQMIAQAKRHGATLGALFIDLDEFKMVNDTLGHAGGDELLKEVAVRLQSCVRSGDTVARISGDEFAVVLADLAKAEDAAIVAQKVIERIGKAVEIHGQEVFVTASVGVALFPGDGADAEALLGAADAAMYRAKQSGRNAFQFFTAEINQRSRARAQLGIELRRALEREEFALAYQPKIRLADGEICGAEALLRWRHPERGVVSPAEFIPVLEETGLIVPVGEWVLRRACADIKQWQAAGQPARPVAVNLSARQFRLQDLDQRIQALVAQMDVDPALVELEITESQLMQDPSHAIRIMRSLRDAGMRIAIDDFGTGYSSLAYLTRFPVASLKIDRSFVADLKDDAQDAAIVRTIIEMAHTLGFTVVAEGIEDEYQAEYLRAHGCEQGQGFLFARPMPAAEYAARLAQGRGSAAAGLRAGAKRGQAG